MANCYDETEAQHGCFEQVYSGVSLREPGREICIGLRVNGGWYFVRKFEHMVRGTTEACGVHESESSPPQLKMAGPTSTDTSELLCQSCFVRSHQERLLPPIFPFQGHVRWRSSPPPYVSQASHS